MSRHDFEGARHHKVGMKDRTMDYKLGQVVKRKTCFLCGKRRICRMDTMNRYFTAECSGKLIPVCLSNCSRYKTVTGADKA